MSGLTLRGVRSSAPVAMDHANRYGGLTTCFDVELASGDRLLIDGGTGLLTLGSELEGVEPLPLLTMLMTHYHWDHILGLPFFRPIFDPEGRFVFHGVPPEGHDLSAAIFQMMRPPWFPLDVRRSPAAKQYFELDEREFEVGDVRVRWTRGRHPQGVTVYRLDRPGRSVVVATDVEAGDPAIDRDIIDLAQGADILVHDSQYHPDEYELRHQGWGHSTWERAAGVAKRAEVGHLVLTAHDPQRTDAGIDEICEMAAGIFSSVEAAHEGMVIPL